MKRLKTYRNIFLISLCALVVNAIVYRSTTSISLDTDTEFYLCGITGVTDAYIQGGAPFTSYSQKLLEGECGQVGLRKDEGFLLLIDTREFIYNWVVMFIVLGLATRLAGRINENFRD